jgi:catalase (peroxidase I)
MAGRVPLGHPPVPHHAAVIQGSSSEEYAEALANLDIGAVKQDLIALFHDSQEWWPADFGNYGPFFVRLAWPCSGSYRTSDGRGGCAGGRQRFDPERSWDDNTNLDKARKLLWPIKQKYGLGLTWGDLFILAGTTALESMGAPVLGFCAGRVDDDSGYESLELGPTEEQQEVAPCPVNGQCERPLGSTTVGLIYLNPEGPMGQPLPDKSALEIRDTFGRMAMNDSETVALIGGGHTFGKPHGACPKGAGPSPKEDPFNPWPGMCGTGKGNDTFTSGFEFQWTPAPTKWDNAYFQQLVNYDWEVFVGPGGKHQWRVKNSTTEQHIGMLTSDIGLTRDPAGIYQKIVKEFATDADKFGHAFSHAWYKLTTRDMGPVTRCVGKDVPPAQDWQFPLPATPAHLADFSAVKEDLKQVLSKGGEQNTTGLLARLAWSCASTFRETDFQGGCNGARLRFSPQKDWPANKGLDRALALLAPVKEKYGEGLSWADLIVLAGNSAFEHAGSAPLSFCGGRTDASDGHGSQYLHEPIDAQADSIVMLKDSIKIMGVTEREFVALMGAGHSIGAMHLELSGFVGAWTASPAALSNDYFSNLISEEYESFVVPGTKKQQYKAKGKELYMLTTDLLIKVDPDLQAIAFEYAQSNEAFLKAFSAAWTKVMNADRFKGPTGSMCDSLSEGLTLV